MKNKLKVIAECIANAGYGTDSYDSKTNECTLACYAGVKRVISNEKYWDKYVGCMSESLNKDFYLGFNFDDWHLKVYEDESKEAKRIERD